MKRLLLPLLAALALPIAIEAEPKYEEKIFDEKTYNNSYQGGHLIGALQAICLSRKFDYIEDAQKKELIKFFLEVHKKSFIGTEKEIYESQKDIVLSSLKRYPDCWPEYKWFK